MAEFEYKQQQVLGKKFLVRNVVGTFTVQDEIDMLKYALGHHLIDEEITGMVIILNDTEFDFEVGEGHRIIDYCASDPLLARLKYALVVDTPEKIIHPLVGNIYSSEAKLRPFSTEEAAIEWIIS